MTATLTMPETARDTPVAAADVRLKFAILGVASLVIFVWNTLAIQLGLLAAMIGLTLAAGLGWRAVGRLALLLSPAFVLIVIIQGLWSPFGVTPVMRMPEGVPLLGGATVFTWEGLMFGLVVACRLLVPLLAFQYLFATSTPNEIVLGLVRIGVPYKVAFLVSTTFRFVPFLLEEYNAIRDAQRLRGIDYDRIGIAKRLLALGRLLVPLLVNCLHKAQQLEIALQARGFTGAAERTYLDPSRAELSGVERAAIVGVVAFLLGAIVLRVGFGVGAEVL
jgi:energy-coupling factor transport system permease protein